MRTFSHQCDCTAGPCANKPEQTVVDHEWNVCPFGAIRDPIWRAAVWFSHLLDHSLSGPIAETHSAGLSMAIIVLRGAQAERRAQIEAERINAMQGR